MEQNSVSNKWCWEIWTATHKQKKKKRKKEKRNSTTTLHKNKFKVDKRLKYKS